MESKSPLKELKDPLTAASSPILLKVSGLKTHFFLEEGIVKAVDGVDFTVRRGETLGIVGESGCGKSMTGLSIMGLLPNGGHVVGGSIKFEGRELVGMPSHELRSIRGNDISMIFQDSASSLNPTKTIGVQVAEPVVLHRRASKK